MKLDGLPVVDATKPLSFTVTKRDIGRSTAAGGIQKPNNCAMVWACKREGGYKDVRIHLNYSYILEKDHWVRYRTPMALQREIIAFDRGGAFDPGDYVLAAPHKSDRLGYRVKTGRKVSARRSLKITANVRARPAFAHE